MRNSLCGSADLHTTFHRFFAHNIFYGEPLVQFHWLAFEVTMQMVSDHFLLRREQKNFYTLDTLLSMSK